MVKENMLKALNDQINAEHYSALLYLSMSAWLNDKGFAGFANWMFIQYQEELTHANKFFKYINDRSGKVEVKAVEQVPTEFDNIISIFEQTLEHEQKVSGLINKLVDIAVEERDHAAQSFLQWFVDEQVEEEANVEQLLDSLRLIDGQGNGLFMLDRELSQRVFKDSTSAAV